LPELLRYQGCLNCSGTRVAWTVQVPGLPELLRYQGCLNCSGTGVAWTVQVPGLSELCADCTREASPTAYCRPTCRLLHTCCKLRVSFLSTLRIKKRLEGSKESRWQLRWKSMHRMTLIKRRMTTQNLTCSNVYKAWRPSEWHWLRGAERPIDMLKSNVNPQDDIYWGDADHNQPDIAPYNIL